MKLILTIIFSMGLSIGIFAQTFLDIRSISIKRVGANGPTNFEMKAKDQSQNEITYSKIDSGLLSPLAYLSCNPCRFPKYFATDNFVTLNNRLTIEMPQNTNIYFHLTSLHSDPLFMHQGYIRRKTQVSKRGKTRLAGRIEVFNTLSNSLIAFDNDVILEGDYEIKFLAPYFSGNGLRITDFISAEYPLLETRN